MVLAGASDILIFGTSLKFDNKHDKEAAMRDLLMAMMREPSTVNIETQTGNSIYKCLIGNTPINPKFQLFSWKRPDATSRNNSRMKPTTSTT